MKKNIIFACLAILLYVYSLNTKTMAVDNKHVSSEKVVDAFDKYFSDNGIDMYEEIGKMVFEYEKIAKEGDLMQRSKANNIISTLLDLEKSVLIDTKSGEDRYQNPANTVILYAIAYFNVINCDLAAELLSYAYYNHTLNVVYTPLNGNIVEQSLLVQNIAEGMNTITGSNEFNYDPTDDVSKDLYYSIKQFEYEKKYYDSDEITFHLRDRYDFDQDHNSYDSLLNLAVGTMHAYQQLGLLTPLIVDISVVIEGTVLFSYEIDDDYATIDYVPGHTANLIIPNSILDINSYVDDKLTVKENIVNLLIGTNSRLLSEAEGFLNEKMLKLNNANECFVAIAEGKTKFSDILQKSNVSSSPTLSDILKKMINMDVIEKIYPINDESEKKSYYVIKDRLSLFYYRYIFKRGAFFNVMSADDFYDEFISDDFESYFVPKEFENITKQYLIILNKNQKLSPLLYKIGKYYYDLPKEKKNGEFDVVTLSKNGYDFYEVKFTSNPIDDSVVNEELYQLSKAKIKYNKIGFVSKSGFNITNKDDYYLINLDDMYNFK